MDSKIFTKAEKKSLDKRLEGDKSDPNGLFSARVKPKVKELLEHWFPKKTELEKLVEK